MKLHENCIFCSDELQPFERLLGRCAWCMSTLSYQEQQSNALLALDMDYSFTDDDSTVEDEDNE